MNEAQYQRDLIKKLKKMFPGCDIVKRRPGDVQGFPDILILFKDTWAALEVKLSQKAKIRPNQKHYVEALNKMSFASFIYPENEEDVLSALQSAFRFKRKARVP